MEIDKEIADALEDGQSGGRGVDELAVGAGGGEGTLEDESAFVAGISTGADEGFIGPLAQEKLEGADDDGFAGAGLSGNGGEAGGEGPLEVLDKGEIADAEGGEHCGHARIMQTWRSFFKLMRARIYYRIGGIWAEVSMGGMGIMGLMGRAG
jgi:hypothetical protein